MSQMWAGRPLHQKLPHWQGYGVYTFDAVTAQQAHGSARPQAAGRVYAVTGAEADRSGNLIIGSCVIGSRSLCVLYDSGATHILCRSL